MIKYNYRFVNLNNIYNKSPLEVMNFIRYNGGFNFDENDSLALIKLTSNISAENRKGFLISYRIDRLDKEFDVIKIGNRKIKKCIIKKFGAFKRKINRSRI